MKRIKEYFGVGNIVFRKDKAIVSYTVQSIKDINTVIIPHFKKYNLIFNKLYFC